MCFGSDPQRYFSIKPHSWHSYHLPTPFPSHHHSLPVSKYQCWTLQKPRTTTKSLWENQESLKSLRVWRIFYLSISNDWSSRCKQIAVPEYRTFLLWFRIRTTLRHWFFGQVTFSSCKAQCFGTDHRMIRNPILRNVFILSCWFKCFSILNSLERFGL